MSDVDWTPLLDLRPGDRVWRERVRELFELRCVMYEAALEREGYGEMTPYLVPEDVVEGPPVEARVEAVYRGGEDLARAELRALQRDYRLQAKVLGETFDAWARAPGRPWGAS
jgi:hypothetical protein